MKARWYRMKHKKGLSHPEISLTPLIDTAWVLLVIFMVTGPSIKKEGGLQVELPKANLEEVNGAAKDDIVVFLETSGKLFLNDKQVFEKDLVESIDTLIGKGKERTVFVKADTGASYGKVIELVDKIKYVGGVKYVALATSKSP